MPELHYVRYFRLLPRYPVGRLGVCCCLFALQHVVGHHVYTNVFGQDPDLPDMTTGDLRRLVDRQKYASIYKYQHLYMPPLYGLLGLKVTPPI